MVEESFRGDRIAVALIFGLTLATGCSSNAASGQTGQALGTLRIVEQHWTGNSEAQPDPTTSFHEVVTGGEIVLGRAAYPTRLVVGEATDDALGITIEGVARVNETGGINLNSCGRQQYRLRVGETARFATCSTDVGATWTMAPRGR